MHISDMIRDTKTGLVSHTKVWANVGYTAMTYAFVADALAGGFTDIKLMAFGAIFVGGALGSKIASGLGAKGADNDKPT